jgi:hypothetical protein
MQTFWEISLSIFELTKTFREISQSLWQIAQIFWKISQSFWEISQENHCHLYASVVFTLKLIYNIYWWVLSEKKPRLFHMIIEKAQVCMCVRACCQAFDLWTVCKRYKLESFETDLFSHKIKLIGHIISTIYQVGLAAKSFCSATSYTSFWCVLRFLTLKKTTLHVSGRFNYLRKS